MSMDELYTAMNMFSSGMQKLAISQGINDATQKVDEINQSQLSELEKRQQQSQLANQLALRLTAAGASPQQVAQSQMAVAPPAMNSANDMYQQAVLKNDPKLMSMAKQAQSFEATNAQELEKTKNAGAIKVANVKGGFELEAAKIKAGHAQSQMQNQATKQFDASVKPLIEGLDAIDSMQALGSLKNGVADMAIRSNLARTIGSEKGRIAVQEISQYTGDPSLSNQFMRAIGKAKDGEILTEKDRALINSTVSAAKAAKEVAVKDQLDKHVGRHAGGAFPDEASATAHFVGNSARLRAIAGLPALDSSAKTAGPGGGNALGAAGSVVNMPASAPAGAANIETRISSKTGKPVRVYVDKAGNAIGRAE